MHLETDRLQLRPLVLEDVDAFAAMFADPEVTRYLGDGGTASREQTAEGLRRTIARFVADGFGQLAVVRKGDGEVIGRCGLLVWETDTWTPTTEAHAQGPTELEVGYVLGQPYWGQGYATEAAAAVRDYALGTLGRERLVALIRPPNVGSIRVAEKLGMRHEQDIEMRGGVAKLYALGNGPAR